MYSIEQARDYLHIIQAVKFIPEPYGSQGLFAETGETWREHRHILTPAFSAAKMKLARYLDVAYSINYACY